MKKRTRDGDEESYQQWRRLLLDLDLNERIRHDKEVLLKLSEILAEDVDKKATINRLAELDKEEAKIERVTKKIERKFVK
jgi:hypothetical protein